jgi:hypothetical protein
MTLLLDIRIARTLDGVIEQFTAPAWRGARLEAWLFEDEAARRDAERRLAAAGVQAIIRSAYKPLLHFFLEEADLAGLKQVTIRTPAHETGSAQRFRAEAFPLAGLLHGVDVHFEEGEAKLDYEVVLDHGAGRVVKRSVFAPNRVYEDHLGQNTLSPAGWLRVRRDAGAPPEIDEPIETEFEEVYRRAMAAVQAHPWPTTIPYFETLEIRVETTGIERELPWHDECVSTREGLHEDLYFSILEWLQQRAGLPLGDRSLQPGQIVPDIRAGAGPTHVRVEVLPASIAADSPADSVPLEITDKPLEPARIRAELAAIGGQAFAARSRQGRTVDGSYVAGTLPGLVITAGQHANETSGVVGALRAAKILKQRAGIHFALIPQENPDGYALHRRLREGNPRHMHHAARYTAFGDDLQYRTAPPLYETEARLEAVRLTGAGLHLNLHGYPAHEWTRPLTGYRPRGFGEWAIPKGFYLILRHQPGLGTPALAFLQALTRRLAESPELRAYNESQLAVYRAHVGELPFPVYNSISCQIVESEAPLVPVTLITEYPDETIYGDAFRLAHTTQMSTVLAATELYLAGDGLAQAVSETFQKQGQGTGV